VGALAVGLTGCEQGLPPATVPVAALAEPGAGEASVVFVRPVSPCDGISYSVIADEEGHFVGNLTPGTRVAFPVAPGKHTFFHWSSTLDQVRVEQLPAGYPFVGAARVEAIAGQTHYVALLLFRPCGRRVLPAILSMRRVPRNSSMWPDLLGWLGSTKPVGADRAAGQAALDVNPALVKTYLELGERTLQVRDEVHEETKALEERRRAIDESSP
jgi:hypothetical protein